jgi:hypothetical protein
MALSLEYLTRGKYVLLLSLYLVTTGSAARSQVLVKVVGDEPRPATKFVPIGNDILFLTDSGVFWLDRKSNRSVFVQGNTSIVNSVATIGEDTWIGSMKGAFRLDRSSNRAVPLDTDLGEVASIVTIGEDVWIGAAKGAFRLERSNNRAVPVVGVPGPIWQIVKVGNEVGLLTPQGLFWLDRKSNQALPVHGDTGSAHVIVAFGDEMWLGAEKGTFRVDGKNNQAVPVKGDASSVRSIAMVGDEIWVLAEKGAFLLDRKGNRLVPVNGDVGGARSIVAIGDELWLGADNGAFRLNRKNNEAVRVHGDTGSVRSIVAAADEIWLVTGTGDAFEFDRKSDQLMPVNFGDDTFQVSDIALVDGEIWILTEIGVFRRDQNTKIKVDLDGELPVLTWVFRRPVWLEGDTHPIVSYVDKNNGRPRYDTSLTQPIKVVYNSDLKTVESAVNSAAWEPLSRDGPLIRLNPGIARVYMAVLDGWNNQTEVQTIEGLVIPRWSLTFLLPLLGIGFCVICLALAPYVRYCHMLLMNPFLRNWVSFGAVPLLLTLVPPLRRYIFRRYCRGLSVSRALRFLANSYVVPQEGFAPVQIASTLARDRVIALYGQSGIGKSASIRFLAYQCVSPKAAHATILRHVVPILVDLNIAGEAKPEEMIRSELRKYGDLTDGTLVDVLLDQGGFLFLFDGLNEVSEATMKAVVNFVDMHRNHNYAYLTTQVPSEELKRVSTLMIGGSLSDDKIAELVRNIANVPDATHKKFDASLLLGKFTDDTYKICRIPLQLELLVEMWERSGTLPKCADDLYSYVLGPFVDKKRWEEKGRGDYPDILCELAFTMMAEKRAYDPTKDHLPDELRTELEARKLLTDHGGVLEFRHDRVRAFLAAKHFGAMWRTILADATTLVDPNWDAMLEFHFIDEPSSESARTLLFMLLKRNINTAIRMNSWGQQNRSQLFDCWQAEFSREVGNAMANIGKF